MPSKNIDSCKDIRAAMRNDSMTVGVSFDKTLVILAFDQCEGDRGIMRSLHAKAIGNIYRADQRPHCLASPAGAFNSTVRFQLSPIISGEWVAMRASRLESSTMRLRSGRNFSCQAICSEISGSSIKTNAFG